MKTKLKLEYAIASELAEQYSSDAAIASAHELREKHSVTRWIRPGALALVSFALLASGLAEFAVSVSSTSSGHLANGMAYVVAGSVAGFGSCLSILFSHECRLLATIAGDAICLEAERLVADYSCARAIRDEARKQGRKLYVMDVIRMRAAAAHAGATDEDLAVIDKAYADLHTAS